MAKMFPRVANCCGFGVGGPPAAHQLNSVRLAVQIEAANNTNANPQRAVDALIRSDARCDTDLLTIHHHAIDGRCRRWWPAAGLALVKDRIDETIALIRRCPWSHLLTERKLVIHACLVHVGDLRARGSLRLTLTRMAHHCGLNPQRTSG